jgi:hypothetical protein
MVALAVPILGLIGLAMLVAWANDRRRGRRAEAAATADDRRTPIEPDSAPQP